MPHTLRCISSVWATALLIISSCPVTFVDLIRRRGKNWKGKKAVRFNTFTPGHALDRLLSLLECTGGSRGVPSVRRAVPAGAAAFARAIRAAARK